MKLERYEFMSVSDDMLEFEFLSIGPKGIFFKIIQFEETNDPCIYELVFGNLLPDERIDLFSKNDNGDRNKILLTVCVAIYRFALCYPGRFLYFAGSTPARTRLYKMALSMGLPVLDLDLDIYGLQIKGKDRIAELFSGDRNYDMFIIKRKSN